jgi:hypothetical protein
MYHIVQHSNLHGAAFSTNFQATQLSLPDDRLSTPSSLGFCPWENHMFRHPVTYMVSARSGRSIDLEEIDINLRVSCRTLGLYVG